MIGKPSWLGAWGRQTTDLAPPPGAVQAAISTHGPWEIPPLPEGLPQTKPLAEDAPHFLIRQVRAHPGQVTIYSAGPLTNIALAVAIDPQFVELTRGIVIMGSSINPQTDDPEFATSPRHEFNFWFDPEAAHIVLRAHWPRIDVTTVDVSIKAMLTQEMFDVISRSSSPAAQYIARFAKERYYLWDELAACAWIDPCVITKIREVYMDVDLSHGPSYGHTLTWAGKVEAGRRRTARACASGRGSAKVHEDVRGPDVGAPADAGAAGTLRLTVADPATLLTHVCSHRRDVPS